MSISSDPSVAPPAYSVKRVEIVMKTADVLARVFTLVPGDSIPWHRHELGSDHYFVLEGTLTVSTEFPSATLTLTIGQRGKVDPGTHHQVSNLTALPVSFLLLQGVGGYDWIKVDK